MSRLLVTESAVRAAVVDAARGELGKHYGVGAWTPYGAWYGDAWTHAYFCAAGWSWAWDRAVGEDDARAVIGYQTHGGTAPNRRGFIWTVAMITQHRGRSVPLRDLRPGDALMFRYNSGDNRAGNEVNHADLVEVNHPAAGYADCIGFNVPKPGAPPGSDPGRGGGVWRRRIYYNNPWVVAGLRMPAGWLADRNRGAWAAVQRHATDLGIDEFAMTGTPGPKTRAAVKAYAATYGFRGNQADPLALLPHMEDTVTNILDELRRTRQAVTALDRKVDRLPTAPDNAAATWAHPLYGLHAHVHLRRGLITDPDHRNFPADPGSLADHDLRAQVDRHGFATVHTPAGVITLVLDDEGQFQIKED